MTYLDYAATTPTRPEVLEAMAPLWGHTTANPNSIHSAGLRAQSALTLARKTLSELLHLPAEHTLLFTSGGTEANNMALKGLAFGLQHKGKHLISAATEHAAVLEPLYWLASQGWDVTMLPVDADGFINPSDLEQALRADTVLVSLMHGNNEIGTLQDIATLSKLTHEAGALFHTDAVQTVGKLPVSVAELGVDCLSASAHKFYGPPGVGLLTLSPAAQEALIPLLHGGGQEQLLRSGTQPVPLIAGMAKALELALAELPDVLPNERALQDRLISLILEQVPSAQLNGPRDIAQRVPGHVNFSFTPLQGEALVLKLDMQGFYVSSGSACHSSQLQGSHVVAALGRNEADASGTLRVTLGRDTTQSDIDRFLSTLLGILKRSGILIQDGPAVLTS